MKKGKDIKEMNQIHGKREISKKKNIYQILGYTGIDKYGTMDFDVYAAKIKAMPKSDLWKHALSLGMMPTDNIEILQNRLFNEFKSHVASHEGEEFEQKPITKTKKLMSILAEGR